MVRRILTRLSSPSILPYRWYLDNEAEAQVERIRDSAILATGDDPILQNILTRAFSGNNYEEDLNALYQRKFH